MNGSWGSASKVTSTATLPRHFFVSILTLRRNEECSYQPPLLLGGVMGGDARSELDLAMSIRRRTSGFANPIKILKDQSEALVVGLRRVFLLRGI